MAIRWETHKGSGGKAVTVGRGEIIRTEADFILSTVSISLNKMSIFCSYKTKDIENCICNLKLDPLNWLFQKHTKVTLQARIQKYTFHQPKGIMGNKYHRVDFVSNYIQNFYSVCLSGITKQ